MKGSDPEGYRYTLTVPLFMPPPEDSMITVDTTAMPPTEVARVIVEHVRAF